MPTEKPESSKSRRPRGAGRRTRHADAPEQPDSDMVAFIREQFKEESSVLASHKAALDGDIVAIRDVLEEFRERWAKPAVGVGEFKDMSMMVTLDRLLGQLLHQDDKVLRKAFGLSKGRKGREFLLRDRVIYFAVEAALHDALGRSSRRKPEPAGDGARIFGLDVDMAPCYRRVATALEALPDLFPEPPDADAVKKIHGDMDDRDPMGPGLVPYSSSH
jgi:hypothetical protein